MKRRDALRKLYEYWDQFDSWTGEDCTFLAAGLDPDNPLKKNGPLIAIEDSEQGLIARHVSSATDLEYVSRSRIAKEVFCAWAIKRIPTLVVPEFLDFFGAKEALSHARRHDGQIAGKTPRQQRLTTYINENWGAKPVDVTREVLRERFLRQNPDIRPVAPSTFAKDLSELKVKLPRGRPEGS
jgi:hypothetical protein